jgi:hypothetical protein
LADVSVLRYLPDGLVNGFDIGRDVGNVLNRAIMCDDYILHVVVPEFEIDELAEKPRANDLEFSSKDTARINVAVSLHEPQTINARRKIKYLVYSSKHSLLPKN